MAREIIWEEEARTWREDGRRKPRVRMLGRARGIGKNSSPENTPSHFIERKPSTTIQGFQASWI